MADSLEVTVGRMTFRVPVNGDPERTLRAIEAVNERLRGIEESAPRIDDLLFALLAAVSFAEELEQERDAISLERNHLEAERQQDTRDFLIALDRLSDDLAGIMREVGRKGE